MIWQELTSTAFSGIDRSTPVVLPLAAVEQHGPHLPLATDRIIGEYFASELHKAIPDQVLILPAVVVGCSEHHMEFPGSLTLSHETFRQQVTDLLDSVIHHGFHNLILFNSHGGNQGIGQVLLEQVGRCHPECRVVLATWWKLAAPQLAKITTSGPGGVGHACEFETSLMLLAAPELVDTQAMAAGGNVATFEWAEADMLRGSGAGLFRTMKQMTENGVYGRPDLATREKGQAIRDVVVPALTRVVLDLAESSPD